MILRLRSTPMTLPVILASGGIVPENVAAGSLRQPVRALPKPFSSDQLLATVADVLRPACHLPDGPGVSLHVSGESFLHWGLNE